MVIFLLFAILIKPGSFRKIELPYLFETMVEVKFEVPEILFSQLDEIALAFDVPLDKVLLSALFKYVDSEDLEIDYPLESRVISSSDFDALAGSLKKIEERVNELELNKPKTPFVRSEKPDSVDLDEFRGTLKKFNERLETLEALLKKRSASPKILKFNVDRLGGNN